MCEPKAFDQQVLKLRDPGSLLWSSHSSVLTHSFHSCSFVANSLLRSTAGVAAARASRSKLSASSKTAFLALGSVNCPATSRACSARSGHPPPPPPRWPGAGEPLPGFVQHRRHFGPPCSLLDCFCPLFYSGHASA